MDRHLVAQNGRRPAVEAHRDPSRTAAALVPLGGLDPEAALVLLLLVVVDPAAHVLLVGGSDPVAHVVHPVAHVLMVVVGPVALVLMVVVVDPVALVLMVVDLVAHVLLVVVVDVSLGGSASTTRDRARAPAVVVPPGWTAPGRSARRDGTAGDRAGRQLRAAAVALEGLA